MPARYLISLIAGLLFFPAPVSAQNAAPTKARPNILLILADDLGYSDLGCYGGEIKTPQLDKLAKDGLAFLQFYNTPRCCPSRASLMTGLYAHQAGVGNMVGGNPKLPGYRGRLDDRSATIAQLLRLVGYRTFMVGKWHLGTPGPMQKGFDDYYGLLGGYTTFWDSNEYVRLPEGEPKRAYPPGKFHATDAFTDHALDFLAKARPDRERPWFLYLAYTAPHFPLHAFEEDIARYEPLYQQGWDKIRQARYERMKELGIIDPRWPLSPRSDYVNRWTKTKGTNPAWDDLDLDRKKDLARRMAVYAAMTEQMDRGIGRVVEDLRNHKDLDNTLIFFLSDNGGSAEWDPFGFDRKSGPDNILHRGEDLKKIGSSDSYVSYGSGWGNASNTPFRWYKHYTYEGGVSSPLIVHWPAGIKDKGKLRNQVGHLIDVMPTCLEVAQAKYPEKLEGTVLFPLPGKSLVPALADRPLPRDFLCWEHEGNRAIRAGKWKLVASRDQPWELYDLEADRVEMKDQAAQHPDLVKDLSARWQSWARDNQVFPSPFLKQPVGQNPEQ